MSGNDERIANWKKDHRDDGSTFAPHEYYNETFQSINNRLRMAGEELHSRILEIGCGEGAFLAICHSNGFEAVGVNPRLPELSRASEKDTRGVIVQALGESLPIRDEAFDCVASTSVLEHVIDPAAVISESVRVLKPKGILYIGAPDYSKCFREGHYGIRWFPMPKRVARVYLWLRGVNRRDREYLESLQFITRRQLIQDLRLHRVTIIDLNHAHYLSVRKNARQYFMGKIDAPETIRSPVPRKIITALIKIGVGKHLMLILALFFYTPILRLKSDFSAEINLLVRKEQAT